jgi:hypothetical protein
LATDIDGIVSWHETPEMATGTHQRALFPLMSKVTSERLRASGHTSWRSTITSSCFVNREP